jgi:hypothetical protein
VIPDLQQQPEDRFIHAQTIVSRWDSEPMDRDLAVGLLVDMDAAAAPG